MKIWVCLIFFFVSLIAYSSTTVIFEDDFDNGVDFSTTWIEVDGSAFTSNSAMLINRESVIFYLFLFFVNHFYFLCRALAKEQFGLAIWDGVIFGLR